MKVSHKKLVPPDDYTCCRDSVVPVAVARETRYAVLLLRLRPLLRLLEIL